MLIVVKTATPFAWNLYKFMAFKPPGPHSSNRGHSLQRHFGGSKWRLGHCGCHRRWLPCLIKRGGDDLDWRVIPLHITSFIKGLPWPSKGDGQWSSDPPLPSHPPWDLYPPVSNPQPFSAHSGGKLLWAGGIQLHWDGERAVQKRVKFKKLSLFSMGAVHHWKG